MSPAQTSVVINLFQPGIVLFDPRALNDFLCDRQFDAANVLEYFLENENIGTDAIRSGAVFPMYPIVEGEYSLFLGEEHCTPTAHRHFRYEGAPLHIPSGLVIVADLHALMNWDPEFFLAYRSRSEDRLSNTSHLDVAPGTYLVDIVGFTGLRAPLPPRGYGLYLSATDALPEALPLKDFDFDIGCCSPRP